MMTPTTSKHLLTIYQLANVPPARYFQVFYSVSLLEVVVCDEAPLAEEAIHISPPRWTLRGPHL